MRLENDLYETREGKIAEKVAAAWKCEAHRMGPYSPFDIYFIRDTRLCAFAEIRSRIDRELRTFPTVLIDLDKWFPLMQSEIYLKVPAFYIIAYSDGIFFLRLAEVDVSRYPITFKGRKDRPQAKNDLSPVIEIPSGLFKPICDSEGVFELKRSA